MLNGNSTKVASSSRLLLCDGAFLTLTIKNKIMNTTVNKIKNELQKQYGCVQ